MNRRTLLSGLMAALALPGAARADSPVDDILARLRRQGFGSIRVERTLLGRTRILAARDGSLREIVLNPRTGEILRDLWVEGNRGQVPPDADEDPARDPDDAADDDDDDDDDDSDDSDDDGGDDDGGDDGDD